MMRFEIQKETQDPDNVIKIWLRHQGSDVVELIAKLGNTQKVLFRLTEYGISRYTGANGVGIDTWGPSSVIAIDDKFTKVGP